VKVFYSLLLVVFFSGSVAAQVIISGRIKDNKGRPVPGASISIKDSYDGGTADSTGRFTFKTSSRVTGWWLQVQSGITRLNKSWY
jgi:hypothetical protein